MVAHQPIIDAKVYRCMERIAQEMRERGAADILHWLLCMTTDVIGELSFGESFDMLEMKEVFKSLIDEGDC